MSAKQDRTYPRTAADIERRYNFGKSFAEILGIATDAQDTANQAMDAANRVDKNLTAEEIFNRLTNNGECQGIYRENGEIFINASYIQSGEFRADLIKAGVLQSKDGKTFYLDLEQGILKADFSEFSISGKSVDAIAQEKATEVSKQAVANQTQEDIFNKLTNNGKLNGIYMMDGELYINASYIMSGELVADLIKSGVLKSKDGTMQIDLDHNVFKVDMAGDVEKEFRFTTNGLFGYGVDSNGEMKTVFEIHLGALCAESYKQTRLAAYNGCELLLAATENAPVRVGASATSPVIINDKRVSWKDNGDGTFTLIGT